MSFFLDNKGDYCYIKESISYWDKAKQAPRSIQKTIGKVNKETGRVFLYANFLEQSNLEYIEVKGDKIYLNSDDNYISLYHQPYIIKILDDKRNNYGVELDGSIVDPRLLEPLAGNICPFDFHDAKRFGSSYFLIQIAQKVGIINLLKQIFPKKWMFIMNLVLYILIKNDKMTHCTFFINDYHTYRSCSMISQRISEFFDRLTLKQKTQFRKNWIKLVKENEYLALDITTVPSESELLEDVAPGRNTKRTKKEHFNICMLFGEKTYLPMYETIYHGSLTDVKTLQNTINEFCGLIGSFYFKLVMDRGFYSFENVNFMLSKKGLEFILGVPLTANYAKELIIKARNDVLNINNYIKTTSNGDNIRGIQFFIKPEEKDFKIIDNNDIDKYDKSDLLSAFVYFNINRNQRNTNKLWNSISEAKTEILKNKNNITLYKNIVDDFFIIKYDNNDKNKIIDILIDNNKVTERTKNYGYQIIITNSNLDVHETYCSYVKKDVVEKSFHHFKAYLGLDRPYVSGDRRLINKTFIIQLCQIIYCYIHKVMQDNDSFKKFSIKELIKILSQLQVFSIGNQDFIKPITKQQQQIFKLFDIDLPKVDENHKIKF